MHHHVVIKLALRMGGGLFTDGRRWHAAVEQQQSRRGDDALTLWVEQPLLSSMKRVVPPVST